ncbi:hypothetical protein AGMMS49992_10890 [Clostridia bacterium]|nr:hypothetical protein AGMMS49992_10890 [Clostridia bacterium]
MDIQNPASTVVDVSALVDEAEQARMIFLDGGGVTFSGGEPTVQWEAVSLVTRTLKERGINTALETNGTHPRLREIIDWVDHLYIDLKHYDDRRHRALTGCGLSEIVANIRLVVTTRDDLTIRIPFINQVNASDADVSSFAALLKGLGVKRIEPLRYHEYGKEKWIKAGKPYTVENGHLSDGSFNHILDQFRDTGFVVSQS